jgi:hypothetical protein
MTPLPQPPPASVAAAPSAVVVVAPAPRAPFAPGQVWAGQYVCSQGPTELLVRITDVQGTFVQAVFVFRHTPSGAAGEYELRGAYDAATQIAELVPGEWIVQPPRYVTVGMRGQVSSNAADWSGTITNASCGAFRLQRTQ